MIVLDHFIMRAKDKVQSARFLGKLLNIKVSEPEGPFMPVKVNETLTIEFDDRNEFVEGHCAFLVDSSVFDQIHLRIQAMGITYGGSPDAGWNHQIGHTEDGRRVAYTQDPDGNTYEFFTPPT